MASILVLGGTSWLGGTVAAHAVALGHHVTCLARGESGQVAQGAGFVRADRADPAAYEALPARDSWDLVVDVARQPGHVRGAVAALAERSAHWAFVSSCSVYARHDEPGADESAALLPALESDEATPEQYGEGKVACEQAVLEARGSSALIARSGLIVGGGDPSDRFGYWPGRFAQAAEDGRAVLVPDCPDQRVQWVDVVDLAAWVVSAGRRSGGRCPSSSVSAMSGAAIGACPSRCSENASTPATPTLIVFWVLPIWCSAEIGSRAPYRF